MAGFYEVLWDSSAGILGDSFALSIDSYKKKKRYKIKKKRKR